MTDDAHGDLAAVAREILDYLQQHPEAKDTFDGVVQWWLIRQRYLRGVAQVEGALDLLIEQGWVQVISQLNGTRIYAAGQQLQTDKTASVVEFKNKPAAFMDDE